MLFYLFSYLFVKTYWNFLLFFHFGKTCIDPSLRIASPPISTLIKYSPATGVNSRISFLTESPLLSDHCFYISVFILSESFMQMLLLLFCLISLHFLLMLFLFNSKRKDFPRGTVVKTTLQCEGCRFDPWPGSLNPTCLLAKKKPKQKAETLV